MMKKVLFIAHMISHIKCFHIPHIEALKFMGYEVHVMTNAEGEELPCCDKLYDLKIVRSPFSPKNLRIIREAKKIIDSEGYELIHSHTPMGGVIGRLSSVSARKKGTKVFYTAHGFHFYKGAPVINWLVYYNVEKFLSFFTDCIITINEEDYSRAKNKFETKKTSVKKINGIGVNLEKFAPLSSEEKLKYKNKYGYEDKYLLIYAAEFSIGKKHKFIVDCVAELKQYIPNIKILFCGTGALFEQVQEYVKEKEVFDYIDFLGYRHDMPALYGMSDILITASEREGLATNVIEGIAEGLPVIATDIRGHIDIIEDGKNGYLFPVDDKKKFISVIQTLANNEELYKDFSNNAIECSKDFDLENSIKQMKDIYKEYGIEDSYAATTDFNNNTGL